MELEFRDYANYFWLLGGLNSHSIKACVNFLCYLIKNMEADNPYLLRLL